MQEEDLGKGVFKKTNVNFESILQKQREIEEDEKFVISDSLQKFIDDTASQAGYQNQEKLDKAKIRPEIVNFVEGFTITNLDGLKGSDYDESVQLQKTTEKQLEEIEKTGQLRPAELTYIKATVGETNKKLGELLGVSTRLKLAFRDFKKELKPLKLAARLGINKIPIIGKRIDRAIRAEEEGEAEALRIKRGLRKRGAREGRQGKGDTDVDVAVETPSETQQTKTQAKQVTSQILGIDQGTPTNELFGDRETQVEQERESDKQFDTTSNILERILEESELTNELLGGKKGKKGAGDGDDDGKDGFSILEVLGMKKLYDFVKAGRVGTLVKNLGAMSVTAGLFAAAAVAGIGIAKVIEKIGTSNVGPKELEGIKRRSTDLSSSANNEGVLAEDIEAENEEDRQNQLEDEYDRGIKEGKLPKDMTFNDYKKAKEDAGIKRELKFEGFMGMNFLGGEANRLKSDADYRLIGAQHNLNKVNEAVIQAEGEMGTGQKIETANTIQADAVEKGSQIINNSNNSGNTIVNNQNNVDASNTQNKTEYGSSTIGSKNNTDFVDYY